jgi:hypothetical protein
LSNLIHRGENSKHEEQNDEQLKSASQNGLGGQTLPSAKGTLRKFANFSSKFFNGQFTSSNTKKNTPRKSETPAHA